MIVSISFSECYYQYHGYPIRGLMIFDKYNPLSLTYSPRTSRLSRGPKLIPAINRSTTTVTRVSAAGYPLTLTDRLMFMLAQALPEEMRGVHAEGRTRLMHSG